MVVSNHLVSWGITIVLFQHTFGTHPKPLPTSYNGIPIIGTANGGLPGVCDIGVCRNFLGIVKPQKLVEQIVS